MCVYVIFVILLQNYEKAIHAHNYRFFWKGLCFNYLISTLMGFFKIIYSGLVSMIPLPSMFILGKELIKYYYNLMQFLKTHQQISKIGVSKSVVCVIKHANFQLYRVHPDGKPCLENLTIDDKFINKRVQLFVHQTCV